MRNVYHGNLDNRHHGHNNDEMKQSFSSNNGHGANSWILVMHYKMVDFKHKAYITKK